MERKDYLSGKVAEMNMSDLLETEYVPGTDYVRVMKCSLCKEALFDQAKEKASEFSYEGFSALLLGHFASHGVDVRLKECDDPNCRWNGGTAECENIPSTES